MFLPSVCEWIGECDKCWKALRAVSRLQKGAIEMQICYHLVEPCIKSTLEEIIENRGTWPSPDQSTIQYLWQHLKTEKAELSVTSQEASWIVSHHAGEHESAGLSLSCWVRAARVHEGGKTEIFMDIFRRFNCSLELTVNLLIEKVLHSKHCFASLSQNFLSYCNALCINLEQAGLM